MNSPLVVLDTPALYYRSFYALPDTVRDASGMPVNAIRGVLDTVATLMQDLGSTRVIAAMDADWRPAFRTAIVPEYKAARITDHERGTETPELLEPQVPVLTELLRLAGIPIASIAGTEADDVIASIVAQHAGTTREAGTTQEAGASEVVIVSPDRDLLSLLGPERRASVYRPRKGGVWERVTHADLPALYGVEGGTQYRMLAALRGDPSDGLAGVPGIGEKTAAKLLAGYGDLEQLFGAARASLSSHGLSPRRRENILAHEDLVRRTFEVMTCREDLPVEAVVTAADDVPGHTDTAGFTSRAQQHAVDRSAGRLLAALDRTVRDAAVAGAAGPERGGPERGGPERGGPAGASADPAPLPWPAGPVYGFDLETTGVNPFEARIVSAALVPFENGRPAPAREWLLDPGVPIPEAAIAVHGITNARVRAEGTPAAAGVAEILDALAAVRDAGGVIVGHNIVYDLTVLRAEALRTGQSRAAEDVVGSVVDTLVIDKQVDTYRKGSRVLTALAARWGVELLDAHDATADAIAATAVALAIAAQVPEVGRMDAAALHAAQIGWKRDQAASFQAYLRAKRDPHAVIRGSWPFED